MKFILHLAMVIGFLSTTAHGNGSSTVLRTLKCNGSPVVIIDSTDIGEIAQSYIRRQNHLMRVHSCHSSFIGNYVNFTSKSLTGMYGFYLYPYIVQMSEGEYFYVKALGANNQLVYLVNSKFEDDLVSQNDCSYRNY